MHAFDFGSARHPSRPLIVGLAAFAGLSAIAGGSELLVWRHGNSYLSPALLEHTPFESFLVPGLLLTLVVGGTSLGSAWATFRRAPAAADLAILAGGTLSVWIVAEVGMMRAFHWLHALYGTTGVALLWLGVRAAWRTGSERERWVIAVTLAETLGFLAPASAGVFAAKTGLDELARTSLLVGAGTLEGLLLGAGQAWAFPVRVRRLRYALLTALGAALVWIAILALVRLVHHDTLSAGVAVAARVVTGAFALFALGAAQWIELRVHAGRAWRWIAWTALAWVVALPLSFTAGPFVDETTPAGAALLLWGSSGLLMALAMALVTWQGVRRLFNP